MSTPRAARLQGGANGADDALVTRARIGNARRRWWWGMRFRTVPACDIPDQAWLAPDTGPLDPVSAYGAWCYLCGRFIVTWSSSHAMPESARLAVAEHRTEHIQGRLDPVPNTEATGDDDD